MNIIIETSVKMSGRHILISWMDVSGGGGGGGGFAPHILGKVTN